jgi:hypothetical protein
MKDCHCIVGKDDKAGRLTAGPAKGRTCLPLRQYGRKRNQHGGALAEVGLVSTFIYAPLLIGLAVVGISTINRIQLDQLVRDVGIMHARGVDFSTASGRELLLKLTEGSPFQASDNPPVYNGTVIISTIRMVRDTDCSNCSNVGQPVVTYRIVLGDPNLYGSRFSQPANIAEDGRVPNWHNDATARAPGIADLIVGMQPGDEAFVAEGYMRTPSIAFPQVNSQAEVASWAIF